MRRLACGLLALLAWSAGVSPVGAQTARSSSGDARATQQLQQLAQDRTRLEAENAALKRELAELKSKSADAEKQRVEGNARAGRATAQLAAAAEAQQREKLAADQLRGRLDDLVVKFRETGGTLRTVEAERLRLDGELGTRNRELGTCRDQNAELYSIALEVLDRYEQKGFWDGLGRAEPFTGIARTRIENFADEYRERATELRLKRSEAAAASAAPKASPAP